MQVNQSGDPRSGDQYADKKGMMRPKAIEIRQNAISQSLKHESAALGWQWTDVVLVASTAALAAAGGAAGIAKATISTTGNTSSIAASAAHIDPVAAGLLAVGAGVVSALTLALGPARRVTDHLVAVGDYVRLRYACEDFVTDLPFMAEAQAAREFVKLRAQRDKVIDRTAKVPTPHSELRIWAWIRSLLFRNL